MYRYPGKKDYKAYFYADAVVNGSVKYE